MTKATIKGHFYVTELPDGKFVAASNYAPYFCFRADTEEAVKAKVEAALIFYTQCQIEPKKMEVRPPARIHNWANRRSAAYPAEPIAAVG